MRNVVTGLAAKFMERLDLDQLLWAPNHRCDAIGQGDNKDFEQELAEQLFAGEDNTDKKNVSAVRGRCGRVLVALPAACGLRVQPVS